MINCTIPIVGFVAYSGTGKTSLLTRLIPILKARGTRVGMIKHAHHDFDIDVPGKDSYELRKAGAEQMLVAGSQRWALMVETPLQDEPQLETLIQQLNTQQLDLILVEGFKHVAYPKIECIRPSLGHELLCLTDPDIIAVASDASISHAATIETPLPEHIQITQLDINSPELIAHFIQTEILDQYPNTSA